MKGGTTHRGEVIRHPCPYLGSSDGSSSHRSPWTRLFGSSSNHGTELLPKAVTVLGLIDIQENARAHANPQLCGAELEIPLAHRGWVPGVTETMGSGANLGC